MKKIIKVDENLKNMIYKKAGVNSEEIAVILFETSGVRLYLREYGKSMLIDYSELKD